MSLDDLGDAGSDSAKRDLGLAGPQFGMGARLAFASTESAKAMIAARPELLSAATAEAVREAAGAAERMIIRAPEMARVAVAARAMSEWLHHELDRPEQAVEDRLRRITLIHQLTDVLDGYDAVVVNATEVAREAQQLGRADVFVDATYLAADASYWGSTKVDDVEAQARLSAAYELLSRLSPSDLRSIGSFDMHQFSSLCDAMCRRQAELGPPPVPALANRRDLLRQLFGAEVDLDQLLRRAWMRSATLAPSDGQTRISRLFYAAQADEVVGKYLTDVLADTNPTGPEVFDAAELGSARVLLDGVVERWPQIDDDAVARDLARRVGRYDHLPSTDAVRRERELVSALEFGSSEDDMAQRREAALALDARAVEIGVGYPAQALAIEAPGIQSRLRPDEVLIRYVLPHHPSHPAFLAHAVVVTRSEVRLVRLRVPERDGAGFIGRYEVDSNAPLDLSPLGNAVVMARLAAGAAAPHGTADVEHLVALDEMVLAPVRETGLLKGASHLIIVPQRSLHMAPWMALRSPESRWLIDDAAVTVAPSATVWARLRDRHVSPVRRAVVLGDVDATSAGLPRLAGSARQVELLSTFLAVSGLDVRSLTGERATLDRLRDALAGAQILDLSSHGSFPHSLLDHAFWLTPDVRTDGRVTSEQVRALRLDGASVVLGVCNGGAYRVGPGDEPYGLVPAFLEAGAVNVTAVQWPIPDEPAAEFLLQVGMELPRVGPAEALRLACLRMRDTVGDAAARLSFVCVGDGRAPV